MIRFLRPGDWSVSQVNVNWTPNTRRLVPEVESAIQSAWTAALARPGVHLFDGPMCRLESWNASDDRLHLTVSKSSYKAFMGTNMTHPEFAGRFGPDVMANPVGVSPALLTADGHLLLGRRTATMAYYPSRVHPFAGCMEPSDAGPFATAVRELKEELSLEPNEIGDVRCTGIAEDRNLVQPELIFAARTTQSLAEIESRLDKLEHDSIWAIPATADAIQKAVAQDNQLTPVAVAALLYWGRVNLGQAWFDRGLIVV
jgi:8-oxo-dGTP pyrophosphatase MutT (NUDIX family)